MKDMCIIWNCAYGIERELLKTIEVYPLSKAFEAPNPLRPSQTRVEHRLSVPYPLQLFIEWVIIIQSVVLPNKHLVFMPDRIKKFNKIKT